MSHPIAPADAAINELLAIMAALRHPVTGCPWDQAQNFSTIAPFTLEEVIEAIARDDMIDLQDELGDLLLQVVFHAQMAEEAGHFDFLDVVSGIKAKLIRRHPHVFGDGKADNPAEVKTLWEAIKATERAEKARRRAASGFEPAASQSALLDSIPAALPGLIRAMKLQQKAASVGFDWNDPALVLEKIAEETLEVREALASGSQAALADEIGDLLFATINLARHAGLDPETCLQATNAKFTRRFGAIEAALAREGRSLLEADLDEMERLWVAAKTLDHALA
jgi:nucleoside triphosphate diphosphatase